MLDSKGNTSGVGSENIEKENAVNGAAERGSKMDLEQKTLQLVSEWKEAWQYRDLEWDPKYWPKEEEDVIIECPLPLKIVGLCKGCDEFLPYIEWEKMDGSQWSRLLSLRPQFEDRCEEFRAWEKMDGDDWSHLLFHQPKFENKGRDYGAIYMIFLKEVEERELFDALLDIHLKPDEEVTM